MDQLELRDAAVSVSRQIQLRGADIGEIYDPGVVKGGGSDLIRRRHHVSRALEVNINAVRENHVTAEHPHNDLAGPPRHPGGHGVLPAPVEHNYAAPEP